MNKRITLDTENMLAVKQGRSGAGFHGEKRGGEQKYKVVRWLERVRRRRIDDVILESQKKKNTVVVKCKRLIYS